MCGNGLRVPMGAADREVLGDLDAKLFAPKAVEAGLRLALAELQPSGETAAERLVALRVELTSVEAERARYSASRQAWSPTPSRPSSTLAESERTGYGSRSPYWRAVPNPGGAAATISSASSGATSPTGAAYSAGNQPWLVK